MDAPPRNRLHPGKIPNLVAVGYMMLRRVSLRGAFATKQSRRFDTKQKDCFASLAMTATLVFRHHAAVDSKLHLHGTTADKSFQRLTIWIFAKCSISSVKAMPIIAPAATSMGKCTPT